MYIDSHSHIEMHQFDSDRAEAIQRARDAGVEIIVAIGNGDLERDSHSAAISIAEQYSFIYTTIGVHPHEARLYNEKVRSNLIEMSHHPKVIAWGEIGLDYHYDNSPRDAQIEVFRIQLRLANQTGLPIVIHTREAEEDTYDILNQEMTGSKLPVVLHSFSSTRWLAEKALELGYTISFSGMITFPKANDLREIAKMVPLDRMLIETDSPYLAPIPYRGRRNEPAYVIEVARCIAELHETTVEEAGRITSENFKHIFNIDR